MAELPEAFLQYVRPHWHGLHMVARRYAVNGDDACDLVQETLLRAWRRFSCIDETTHRRAWLFVILRNVALEWQRSARRKVKLVLLPSSELTEISPPDLSAPFHALAAVDEEQFREFLDDRLAAALDALEAPFREVIILSVAGGLSYREIADVLDCPLGTVMSRMARARRTLRERLADLACSTTSGRGKRS